MKTLSLLLLVLIVLAMIPTTVACTKRLTYVVAPDTTQVGEPDAPGRSGDHRKK